MDKFKLDEIEVVYDRLKELIKAGDRDGAVQYMKENDITPKTLEGVDSFYLDSKMDPLATAACQGDLEMVKRLIDMGFSVEGLKCSTLVNACIFDKPEIVEYLVQEHHVNLEAVDTHCNGPPLKVAIEYNSLLALKCLLDLGVSPNMCYDVSDNMDYDEEVTGSALHHAVLTSSKSVCQLLIDGGADVNINPEGFGSPPLFIAVSSMLYEISLMLIKAGADVNYKNFEGMTPFLSAVAHLSDTVVNTDRRIKDSCGILDLLRCYGADPEVPDGNGMTALHHAVFHCSVDMLRYLVLQVNVSLKNTQLPDQTLFSLAIKRKRWVNYDIFDYGDKCCEVMEFLVRAGYDLREEPSIFDDDLPLMAHPRGCMLIAKLRDLASTPRSLKDVCVFKIRELLGCGARVSASFLPVPKPVLQMIKLHNLRIQT